MTLFDYLVDILGYEPEEVYKALDDMEKGIPLSGLIKLDINAFNEMFLV